MSGMRNLHRIMGARFEHVKPNLCPGCRHNWPHPQWEGYCTAKEKILSAAIAKRGRCADYAARPANGNGAAGATAAGEAER